MAIKQGRLIVLEGGEGAGKSTHAHFVREWLEAQGRTVVLTREPGGTPLAEAIRTVLLDKDSAGMSPMTELLLMFAARAAHVRDLIRPALVSGNDVVCDRFVDASYAYQGGGRGIASSQIAQLENMTLDGLKPDRVIIFDLPPSLGLQRTQKRGEQNRFEAETLAFMERVRQVYLDRAHHEPTRYRLVDASGSLEEVQTRLKTVLEQLR